MVGYVISLKEEHVESENNDKGGTERNMNSRLLRVLEVVMDFSLNMKYCAKIETVL